jgi:hypothetical protein
MKKLLLTTAILFSASTSFAEEINPKDFTIEVIKPLVSYHFKERSHPQGLKYNENHLASLGLGIRQDISGFGASIIYVDKNSLDHNAVYLQIDNMQEVAKNIYIGGAVGFRNGSPKKSANRNKSDFLPYATLNAEYCINKACLGFIVAPIEDGVVISNLKYKF